MVNQSFSKPANEKGFSEKCVFLIKALFESDRICPEHTALLSKICFPTFAGKRLVQGHALSYAIRGGLKFFIFRCLWCLLAIYDLFTCTKFDLGSNNFSDFGQTNKLGNFLGRLCRWSGTISCCVPR